LKLATTPANRAAPGTTPPASKGPTSFGLSRCHAAGSIVPSETSVAPGANVTWTATGGFGAGTLQYYRYAWDQSPTHTFDDTEPQWGFGTISTTPSTTGTWYLHVKGFNGTDVANGTYDYAVTASQSGPKILSMLTSNHVVTLTWSAASGAVYRVQYAPDLGPGNWSNLLPDVQAAGPTASATDDTGGAFRRFYQVMLLP
jgi:hypothetical protein